MKIINNPISKCISSLVCSVVFGEIGNTNTFKPYVNFPFEKRWSDTAHLPYIIGGCIGYVTTPVTLVVTPVLISVNMLCNKKTYK